MVGGKTHSTVHFKFTLIILDKLIKSLSVVSLVLALSASIFFIFFGDDEAFASVNNNLTVETSSFLGSLQDDVLNGVGILPDKTIIIGGEISPDQNFSLIPVSHSTETVRSPSSGVLLRLTPNGKSILHVARIGSSVDDISISKEGLVYAVGDFGVVQLNSTLEAINWSKSLQGGGSSLGDGRRISAGEDGTVAVLGNKRISVYSKNGEELGSFISTGSFVNDLALDASSQTVIVTGFSQRDGGPCTQLQVAFLRGFSYTGTEKWKGYDWSHAQANSQNSSCADSRGNRVTIGEDGKAYFAGETAGGNTIFRYGAQNINDDAPNVKYDRFNDPFNTGANHITYYTRLEPSSGRQDVGQFNLARLSSGSGNTIRPYGITSQKDGTTLIVGSSAASLANRNNQQINGGPIGPYSGGDNFVLSVRRDFSRRDYMTTFTNGCNAVFNDIATFEGLNVAVGSTNSSTCSMVTISPIQQNLAGGKDGFFSVWGNITNDPVYEEPIETDPADKEENTENQEDTNNQNNTGNTNNPDNQNNQNNQENTNKNDNQNPNNNNVNPQPGIVDTNPSNPPQNGAPVNNSNNQVQNTQTNSSVPVYKHKESGSTKSELDARLRITTESTNNVLVLKATLENLRFHSGDLVDSGTCSFVIRYGVNKSAKINSQIKSPGTCSFTLNSDGQLFSLFRSFFMGFNTYAQTILEGSPTEALNSGQTGSVQVEIRGADNQTYFTSVQSFVIPANSTPIQNQTIRSGGQEIYYSIGITIITMLIIIFTQWKNRYQKNVF